MPARLRLALVAFVALAALGSGAVPALAAHNQVAMLEDTSLISDPNAALAAAKQLGVQQERLYLSWKRTAPHGTLVPPAAQLPGLRSRRPTRPAPGPSGTTRSSPARRPGSRSSSMSAAAPLWALGPHMPKGLHPSWEPNPGDYAAFVRAVGERYSGNYNPHTNRLDPGNPDDLPAVRFWSFWNEPNYGPSLAPQGVIGNTARRPCPAALPPAGRRRLALAAGHRPPARHRADRRAGAARVLPPAPTRGGARSRASAR